MITLIGEVIGGCRLEMTIGSGALGDTFRAAAVDGGRLAVVKILHPSLTGGTTFPDRFREHLSVAASLRHPNVLAVSDYGEYRGKWYIVMEFVADGSLRTLLHRRGSHLPLRRGVELVRQTAEALVYAHGRGVLHRDIKPENLLVHLQGTGGASGETVKVADFGLTRLAETGVTIGGTASLGSLPYMSPEEVRGLALDARSDVYSLGVVLYEVVTGYPPFQVKTLGEALQKHTTVAPPPPGSVVPGLPPGLEAIVLRCLEKKPEQRYQSASELQAALAAELLRMPAEPLVVMRSEGPDIRFEPEPRAEGPIVVLREVPAPPEPPAPANPPGSAAAEAATPPEPRRYRVRLDESTPAGGAPQAPPAAAAAAGAIRVGRIEVKAPRPTLPEPGAEGGTGDAVLVESRRIRVALDKTVLILTPGQPAVFTVTLMNAGRTVDHFTLSVAGVPAAWVRCPLQPEQLNPGHRATVAISVTVPRASSSHAGPYPVQVRARSRENPAEAGSAPAEWTVLPFAQAGGTLVPSRARGWRRARYALKLRNDGNAPAWFALTAADEEKGLRYAFERPQLDLGPGEEASVCVTTDARLRLVGAPVLRSFVVRAEPTAVGVEPAAEAQPAVPGQFVHRALIPPWLPPLLLMLLALLYFGLKGRGDVTVAIQPPRLQLAIGTTAKLAATVTNRSNEVLTDRPIRWTSRDTLVAVVTDSGLVRGRREGVAVILASSGKAAAAGEVTVVAARVESLSVTPRRQALKVGAATQLRAVTKDGAGNLLRRDVTWLSSDPTVVTVGGNGKVIAKAPGAATVTASSDNKAATAEITVTEVVGGPGAGATDCTNYDPASLAVKNEAGSGWVVGDGANVLLTLDNESDARKALALARRYKAHCYIGRGNPRSNRNDYVIEYWEAPSGIATALDIEDCVGYARDAIQISDAGARGLVIGDGRTRLLLADNREDAQLAATIAQRHRGLCFIGRGNPRANQRDYVVQYWK